MNRHDENDDSIDPRMKLRANAGDKLHDLQLRRDLGIINDRTASELGPLLPDGLPVVPRRKPNLPASASTMPPPMTADLQENETMDFRSMAVAASMALAACAPVQDAPGSGEKAKEKPLRKLNPNPQRAYAVTMKIEGAPGPFAVVRGVAQYKIVNSDQCGERLEFSGVVRARGPIIENYHLVQVSDDKYQGNVYLDLIQDENYYGNGVCRWELVEIRAVLGRQDSDLGTVFVSAMQRQAILEQETATTHFKRSNYDAAVDGMARADYGMSALSTNLPLEKSGIFSTILEIKEEAP